MHIRNLSSADLKQPSIITVGVFDGVHRGHQSLVKQLVAEAHATDRAAVVLTFFPHPDVVLRNIEGRYYLTTPDQRANLLLDLGVDLVVTHAFDETVRHMRAADFADQLIAHLNMSSLWATQNFAMGYKREGNIDFLRAQGAAKGFTVKTVELVYADENGDKISSSSVRDALLAGELERANTYLGRPYCMAGEVVHGEKRGRQIGFPTANLAVWEQQLIPQHGVYACYATLGNERFKAVTNIGRRPTFEGDDVTVEAHLLDFDRDIYGQTLNLDFVAHLRDEMKFNGIENLVAQIGRDVEEGRRLLDS